MALLNWDEKYSVSVPEFDNQHKRLIEGINALHEAMRAGKGKDVLGRFLAELISDTRDHFSAEERFMQSRRYAALAAHVVEHDQLAKKVTELQRDFKEGRITVTIPLMNFLTDWLTDHIMESDKKYMVCLEHQPVA